MNYGLFPCAFLFALTLSAHWLSFLCVSGDISSASANSEEPPKNEGQQNPSSNSSERVTVVAPKRLRPLSEYTVLVTLTESQVPATFDLQVTGARDSNREQIEARSVLVQSGETQTVKLPIGDWPSAEYFLSVDAQAVDKSWRFQREAPLEFHQKTLSGHIQTDKAIYKPGDLVKFRAIFLKENLVPLSLKDEINVTVSDPQRNIVRQWTGLSNWRGLLTLELALSADPMLGDWTISVETRGEKFEKRFNVAEYILPTFDVGIDLPPYATFNDSQVVASVRASYTYGKPVRGHVTLTAQPLLRFSRIASQPLEQNQYRARLESDGRADIEVNMARLTGQLLDSYEREIEFFALVEEDLTGRKYNRTASMKVYSRRIKIEGLDPDDARERVVLKPGLSKLLQYRVAYQDDTPVEDHGPQVALEYSFRGTKLAEFKLRPVGGIVEHELSLPRQVRAPRQRKLSAPILDHYEEHEVPIDRVDVAATYRNQTYHLEQLRCFRSESGQFLQIGFPQLQKRNSKTAPKSLLADSPQANIGDTLKVQLRSTEPMQQVNCQCLARGDLVWVLKPNGNNKTQLEFEVQVDQRMAPEAHLVCFYQHRDNQELVVDGARLRVGGFMRNYIKLAPSRDEAKPGQEIQVEAFTKPDSLVGVLAVDQSVLLLKSGNDISQAQLLEDNRRFAGSGGERDHFSDTLVDQSVTDGRRVFQAADLVVLTNNVLSSEFYLTESFATGIALSDSVSELGRPATLYLPQPLGARETKGDSIVIRRNFAETWLWQNGTADSSGRISFGGRIPDSITSWQLSGFSLSEAHGMGLSTANGAPPTTIRVFRPFFIKLNLPYSIIRGETVNIQAVIFNYAKRATAAKVTLENSRGEFEFVEAANSLEDEVLSNSTSESRLINVPANEGVSVSFLIRPIKVGHIDVKMLALGESAGDGVLRKLLVKAEGQVQHINKAMLIRLPDAEGKSRFKRNVSIEVPANAVRDSQRVYVSAIGEILGAGLANVDDLLRLPYGCGEQNMINLVPNIVIHNYLLNTRRLRDNQRARAKRNIEVGYQRELNYKRADGSFSAFGQADANGSVWLTSYVLKTLQQAKQIITVDPEIIQSAAHFVASLARPDGSFQEVGMLHNQKLASAGGSSPIYLTSYALLALLEAPIPEASFDRREVLDKGLSFLEGQIDTIESAHELAMIAYTMQLAQRQQSADRAYGMLWARANERDGRAWWSTASSAESVEAKANLRAEGDYEPLGAEGKSTARPPPLKPPVVQSGQSAHLFAPDSLAVETGALAVLTAVRRNDLERALPVVHWLVSQQNSQGGYASTQDTVLAIEALAAFAQAAASKGSTGQSIDVEFLQPRVSGASSRLRQTNTDQLTVSQSNALVQQQIRLADNVTWVQVEASGSGLAVVQVSWQYNLLVSAERPAFYLNPIIDRQSTSNYLQLSVCTFYKGPEEASNMAVLDVELPSGYAADAEALPSLKRNPSVKRVETDQAESKVIVYLDKVGRDEICLTVPAHRSTKVSNNKPVPVFIYDYYDRKRAARIFYEPLPASSCDICEPDTCSERCSSKPRRSERLISLHEQRGLSGQLLAQKDHLGAVRPKQDDRNAKLIDLKPFSNVTVPSASELLPLSPALESLKTALRGE